MTYKLTPHISVFATRVKNMNQSGHKELSLSASEARNLHSEIFQLLNIVVEIQQQLIQNQTNEVILKGAEF